MGLGDPMLDAALPWRGLCRRSYGPGLARFGIDAERLLVVTVRRPAELLWVMEEGVRGGGAVADLTASRRLQLAAENGRAAALALPPAGAAEIARPGRAVRVSPRHPRDVKVIPKSRDFH